MVLSNCTLLVQSCENFICYAKPTFIAFITFFIAVKQSVVEIPSRLVEKLEDITLIGM